MEEKLTKLMMVSLQCLPVRYGHCGYSIANIKDIEECVNLYVEIIKNFNIDIFKDLINFLGR